MTAMTTKMLMRTGTLMQHLELSYRQVDYWCSVGAIVPSGSPCSPGSGERRVWCVRDLQRLQAIERFRKIAGGFGWSEPATDVLHRIWFGLADSERVEIGGDGVTIVVELRDPEWRIEAAS